MSTRARDTADVVEDVSVALAAKSDYALPVNAQTGTTYTFVLADAQKLTTASNAAAVTLTIPPQSSVTWAASSVIRVVNYGAGAVTVNGGSGVTVTNTATTLAQFQSAAAIRTAENAWTLVPFAGGGVGDADFSDAATGTYTDGGKNYKFLTLTSTGSVTITKAGFATCLVIGGGGGAARTDLVTAGAGGGAYREETVFLTPSTITVTIGAGGASSSGSPGQVSGAVGNASSLGSTIKSGGGGQASARNSDLFGGTLTFISPSSGGDGAAGGACFRETNSGASQQGTGCGGTVHATNVIDGRTSSLNNVSTEYGKGGAATGNANGAANTGNGGAGGQGNGGSGVVIVRVRT